MTMDQLNTAVIQNDIGEQLQSEIKLAVETGNNLQIRAGGSKDFYGRTVIGGKELNIAKHQGIISYEPTELVIKARAGTPLKLIEQVLAEEKQMLAFEPPAYSESATLGGTVACNLSGPRRAYSGAVRDYVLGTKIINSKAEILSFGGEVMKNVAGYDVSRLMTGAMGTLGVLLEISIKVVPMPETETTLTQRIGIEEALKKLHQWSNLSLPISASCYYQGILYIRLSATEKAIDKVQQKLGGEILNEADVFWRSVKNQTHDFFIKDHSYWRLSLASNTPNLSLESEMLYEWGGALRWLKTELSQDKIRASTDLLNGHATLFRATEVRDEVFQTLPKHLLKLHRNLKQAFDPHGIFNKGRMYREF